MSKQRKRLEILAYAIGGGALGSALDVINSGSLDWGRIRVAMIAGSVAAVVGLLRQWTPRE